MFQVYEKKKIVWRLFPSAARFNSQQEKEVQLLQFPHNKAHWKDLIFSKSNPERLMYVSILVALSDVIMILRFWDFDIL